MLFLKYMGERFTPEEVAKFSASRQEVDKRAENVADRTNINEGRTGWKKIAKIATGKETLPPITGRDLLMEEAQRDDRWFQSIKDHIENPGEWEDKKKIEAARQKVYEALGRGDGLAAMKEMPSLETSVKDIDIAKEPKDFSDKLKNLRLQKDGGFGSYFDAVNVLKDMSEGGDGSGIRKQYYPDWKDEDFKNLLIELGEDAE